MPYITCENLTLGYDGRAVVENLSFHVNKGDYFCIIGENGAGKTTLMKTVLSLHKQMSGTISIGDGLKPYEIGYLPQQTFVQKDFPASVWEIVLSGTLPMCGKRPFFSKKERDIAKENMKKLSIYDLKDSCYRELSGGQQQRVLLARALCATSKLILLDEPVTGLDPKAGAEFYQLIEKLNKEGVSVIMVTHDINAALSYASHIIHLGKEHSFVGTRKQYLKSDAYKNFVHYGEHESKVEGGRKH